jgi:benzoyl-CoA reductase/2-hydroxyglutaryl-CoA dehydratase subunit BcrC/BadD/HgdB
VKETLRELDELAKQREKELIRRRKEGARVIACSGTYIPEEVIRAAGAETFVLCPGEKPASGDQVLNDCLRFMNPLTKSLVSSVLSSRKNPEALPFDLLVAQQTDCHTARAAEYLAFEGVPVYMTGIPADWGNPEALDYLAGSLRKMMKKVREITGRDVDPDKAKEYFVKTGRINALFRELDDLRRSGNPPFGFSDWIRLHRASFRVDYDLMIKKLEQLCKKLSEKTSSTDNKHRIRRPRILIAGRAPAPCDFIVPEVIEECGAVIAGEFLDEGMRVYEKDIEPGPDLILQFARNRYLDTVPGNFMQSSWENRAAHVRRLITERCIDAVVWHRYSFDEIYDLEYTFISKQLAVLGIPLIKLESCCDDSDASLGRLMTRTESFVEALGLRYGQI